MIIMFINQQYMLFEQTKNSKIKSIIISKASNIQKPAIHYIFNNVQSIIIANVYRVLATSDPAAAAAAAAVSPMDQLLLLLLLSAQWTSCCCCSCQPNGPAATAASPMDQLLLLPAQCTSCCCCQPNVNYSNVNCCLSRQCAAVNIKSNSLQTLIDVG